MNASDLGRRVMWAIEHKRPLMISGPPGLGKSQIVAQVCATMKRPMIDVRTVLYDVVDLKGFPLPDREAEEVLWLKPDFWPKLKNCVLFFDELTQAAPMVQSGTLQLVLDRAIGSRRLPEDVALVAAGNRVQDGCGSHALIKSLNDRFDNIELDVCVDSWQNWAINNGISAVTRSFIDFRPALLHTFDPKKSGRGDIDATPRSWESVDFMTLHMDEDLLHESIEGRVGKGPAGEYMGFRQIHQNLVPMAEVFKHPEEAHVPKDDPATMYAMTGAMTEHLRAGLNGKKVAEGVKQELMSAFSKYAARMPGEFAMLAFRDGVNVTPKLVQVPEANHWLRLNRDKFQK